LRVLAVAAAVLGLGYPIAADLFLAFGGVQRMLRGTENVKVDFRRAWSFWPGRVHVSNLRVTMQDRNVQSELVIPSVDVTVSLRELLHRTFHATRVRGSGVAFRFRHRISRESVDLPFVHELPSIAGFEDPPLYEDLPPSPPGPADADRLWTVHVEDVDVEVSDLWIEMFRFQGSARALGAFRLKPTQRVWVGPAELRFEPGVINKGSHPLADVVGGLVSCTVEDFDVEAVTGWDVFHFIRAEVQLRINKLRLGDRGPCPWMEADAATLEGHVVGQSSGSFEAEFGGELDRASSKWGEFHASAAHAVVKNVWTNEEWTTDIDASHLQLRSEGGPPKSWKADVRSAMVRTKLRSTETGLRGPTRIEASGVAGQAGDTSFEGDLFAALDVGLREPSYRVADAGGTVELRRVAVRSGAHEVRDWWAKLELRKTHLDTYRNFDLKGDVAGHFKDAMPAIYVLVSEHQIPKWTASVLPTQSLEMDLHVARFCHLTDVELAELREGAVRASGRIQAQPGSSRGALLFRLSGIVPLSLGLRFDDHGSDTSFLAGHGWLEKQLAPLSKAAAARRAAGCAPEPTSCN
jgi:hypothetical protein